MARAHHSLAVKLVPTRTLRAFSAKLLFSQLASSTYWCLVTPFLASLEVPGLNYTDQAPSHPHHSRWALQPMVLPSCFRALAQAGRATRDNNSGSPRWHRQVPVPTVGLAASKPTLPPLVHAAGAGFFGKRSEIWLLLPRGVITVQSPWDWSDLPDSCAPEQHEHSRSLAEGRPPSPHLHGLVARLVASSPAGNSSLCPGQEGSADPAGG